MTGNRSKRAFAKSRIIAVFVASIAGIAVLAWCLHGIEESVRNRASEPQQVLDLAIRLIRDNALNSEKVDWLSLEPTVRRMAKGAVTSAEIYPAIRVVLAKLGDHHSFLMEPQQHKEMLAAGRPERPVVVSASSGIGYISMPGYSGVDAQAARVFSDDVAARISHLAAEATCGWVLDLRDDDGGNMWPMLAGLRSLLGKGAVGAFRKRSAPDDPWHVGEYIGSDMDDLSDLTSAPVAVLYGSSTASSGEAVAIAFIGRPGTKSFGSPTAGLTTGNSLFDLPDGSCIILTTVAEADRSGQLHSGELVPDKLVGWRGRKQTDDVRLEAETWLAEESHCRTARGEK